MPRAVHNHRQGWRAPYFNPNPLKCWPTRRTISRSVGDNTFTGVTKGGSSWSLGVPLGVAQAPLTNWEVDATGPSSVSPLCCAQPLVCMVAVHSRCFFLGGDDTPPSSLSDDEARLTVLVLWCSTSPNSRPQRFNFSKKWWKLRRKLPDKMPLFCLVTSSAQLRFTKSRSLGR